MPSVYDVPVKDGIGLMDVAVFRLSKSQKRAGEILRHQYGDAIIEERSGPDGLATIYDYDIVLMMISHLAEEAKVSVHGVGGISLIARGGACPTPGGDREVAIGQVG